MSPPISSRSPRIVFVGEFHSNPGEVGRRERLHALARAGAMYVVAESLIRGHEARGAPQPPAPGGANQVPPGAPRSRLVGADAVHTGVFNGVIHAYFQLRWAEEGHDYHRFTQRLSAFLCELQRRDGKLFGEAWAQVERPFADVDAEQCACLLDGFFATSILPLRELQGDSHAASESTRMPAWLKVLRSWGETVLTTEGSTSDVVKAQAQVLFDMCDFRAFEVAAWHVLGKWRHGPIVENILATYEQSRRAGLDTYVTVGYGHVLDLAARIHARYPNIPLAMTPVALKVLMPPEGIGETQRCEDVAACFTIEAADGVLSADA